MSISKNSMYILGTLGYWQEANWGSLHSWSNEHMLPSQHFYLFILIGTVNLKKKTINYSWRRSHIQSLTETVTPVVPMGSSTWSTSWHSLNQTKPLLSC